MTRTSSHMWSQKDPGERFRQILLDAHFQTLTLFLWALERAAAVSLHLLVHSIVRANVQPEAKGTIRQEPESVTDVEQLQRGPCGSHRAHIKLTWFC